MRWKRFASWMLCACLAAGSVSGAEFFSGAGNSSPDGWDTAEEAAFSEEWDSSLPDEELVFSEGEEAELAAEELEISELPAADPAKEDFEEDFFASEEALPAQEDPDALVGISYTLLPLNTQITQRLSDNKEEDWYAITVPAPGSVSISFSHEYLTYSGTYWYSYLYDTEQKEMVKRGYKGNTLSVSTGPKVGVTAGTYYVKITHGSYSGVDYYLTVNYEAGEDYEKEWNESYSTANSLSPNVWVHGTIMETDDKDWYRVVLPQPGTISISFEHDFVDKSTAYWRAILQTETLAELKRFESKGNQGSVHTSEKVGLPAGTYYLQVVPATFLENPYSVRLDYTPTQEWEKEFNDDPSTPNPVAVSTLIHGNLQNSKDVDWYSFSVPSTGYISLSFSHAYLTSSSSYWYVYLYDTEEKELVMRSFKGNTLEELTGPKVGVKPGTYKVKVAKNNSSDVEYQLKLNFVPTGDYEVEWNDTIETANSLTPGVAISGSIMETDDVDYYRLTVPKDDYLTLSFAHDYIESGNRYWTVTLHNSDMKQLNSWGYVGKVAPFQKSDKVDLPMGTYYLKVTKNGSFSDLGYTLLAELGSGGSAVVTPAPVTPVPVTPAPVTPVPVTPVPVTPVPGQDLTIPDDAFEEAVRDALGLDNSDEITQDLCDELDRLNLSSLGIASLEGISYFRNLTYLDCSGNTLASLDVSALTKLAYLDCSNNDLTSLDLRANRSLDYLDVRGNAFASISMILLPGQVETFYFTDEEEEGKDAEITLNKTEATLYVGSSLKKLTLKAALQDLTNPVTFTSSKPSVAKVSAKGVVTAKKKGKTVITAAVEQYGKTFTAKCTVTVKNPTLSVDSKVTVKVGKKVSLKVKTKPNGTITFVSEKPSVATVDKYGVVKGIKKGSTKIVVSCNGITKKVKVTVKK